MATQQSEIQSLDTVKIYIWVMSAFCIITLVWLLYNYFLLNKYKTKLVEGKEDIEKVLTMESQIPPKKEGSEPQTIVNVFQFFKRTVQDIPEPEIEESQWEPGNIGGVLFAEKRFTIRFDKGISRYDLARYIFIITEKKPFLKVKSMEIQKAENTPPHEDKWKVELVFAYRKPKEGK